MKSLKLALLINDTPVQPVLDEFGDYNRIYEHWLQESKPADDVTFQLDPFYVFNELLVYPDAGEYDAIILTGSGEQAPWTPTHLAVTSPLSFLCIQSITMDR
jgi:hypothetical protein